CCTTGQLQHLVLVATRRRQRRGGSFSGSCGDPGQGNRRRAGVHRRILRQELDDRLDEANPAAIARLFRSTLAEGGRFSRRFAASQQSPLRGSPVSFPMIKLESVSKYYKEFPAVTDLSMEIGRGEVFGFIGPNGAGKTTTIKMLATLMLPSAGTITIDGLDVERNPEEVRRLIGYMRDSFGVYDDLLAWEYLDYFAALYRPPPADRKRAINDVLELTDLGVKRNAQVMSLSRGM